jgi:hypothetical protein
MTRRTFHTITLSIGLIMLTLTSHQLWIDIFVDLYFDLIHLLILSWGCSLIVVTASICCLLLDKQYDTDEEEVEA